MNNLIGQQWGNYRLTRLLGQGGFAEVYLAEHIRLKMFAAIKILYTHLSQEGIEAFQNEAQVIANLVHPHIVRLLDFDVKDGRPFLVLDYASNGSLRQRYPKGTRLPLTQVVSYTQQVASALQLAHDQKLIHRDIKPENMLLGQQDTVLLSDFGIASIAHSTSSMNVQSSMGTIPYMAPEQIQGYPRPASDQYALGIVVYQWLSGEVPFQGNSSEIIAQHLGVEARPIRKNIPEIPEDVDLVLAMALAKDPKARFGSVQAFATALEQACKPVTSQQLSHIRAAQAQLDLAPTAAASPFSPLQATIAPVSTPVSFIPATPPLAVQANTPPAQIQGQTPANAMPPYPAYPPYPQPMLSQARQSTSKASFKWGSIFGAVLVAFVLIQAFFLPYWPDLLHYLVSGVAYFCLGIVASSKTGKVATGVLASLWASFWAYLALLILDVIFYTQFYHSDFIYQQGMYLMSSLISGYIIDLGITCALGVVLGALGGLLGRALARK